MARPGTTCSPISDSSSPTWDVLAVAAKELRPFSGAERALLSFLRSEAHGFIDHPLFHRRNVEVLLFGRRRALAPHASRFEEMPASDSDVVSASAITLTAAQEIYLFQRYNYTRMRAHKLIHHYPQEIPDGVLREALAWGHRAMTVRDQLARVNTPLVLAMFRHARLDGVDGDEFLSEGGVALFDAIRKFDCNRGFKFSTYACRAILKSFSRAAMKSSRYRQIFGTEYDPALDHSNFGDSHRSDAWGVSLDELREVLVHNRGKLSELELTVVRERFAIGMPAFSSRPKTLSEVGEIIGRTKEGVRQIQLKALRKLRLVLEEAIL